MVGKISFKLARCFTFVTHDRGFLRRVANSIWELDRGHLFAWSVNTMYFSREKQQPLKSKKSRMLYLISVWQKKRHGFGRVSARRRTRNEGRVRALKQMREERRQRREQPGKANIAIQESGRSGTLVCKATGVCFSYTDNPIINRFSTTILRGDKVGFIGPNGCGKTTLLRLCFRISSHKKALCVWEHNLK